MVSLSRFLPSNLPVLDTVLIAVFMVFLVFPSPIPSSVAQVIDSPVGIAIVVVMSFLVFFTTTPILGVLSLIVAYELLRRSSAMGAAGAGGSYATNSFLYENGNAARTAELQRMNATRSSGAKSLEEEIIDNAVPIGHTPIALAANEGRFIDSSFRPVLASDHGAAAVL